METAFLKPAVIGFLIALVMIELPACQDVTSPEKKPQVSRAPIDPNNKRTKSALNKNITSRSVVKALAILNQSHQFFQEAWRIVVKNKTAVVPSVFKETFGLLQSSFDASGKLKADGVCSQTKNVLKVTEENSANGVKFSSIDIEVRDCKGNYLNWVVSLRLKSNSDFILLFNPSNLTTGAGGRQVSLSLKDKNFLVKCPGRIQDDSASGLNTRVTLLRCENLGQKKSMDSHIVFEYFNYDITNIKILEFKTVSFASDFVTKNATECEKMVVVPQDPSQKITVQETCETEASKQSPQELDMDKKNPLLQPVAMPQEVTNANFPPETNKEVQPVTQDANSSAQIQGVSEEYPTGINDPSQPQTPASNR